MKHHQKSLTTRQPGSQHSRPAIGLLCNMLIDQYSQDMWAGVNDATRHHGANLLYIAGGILEIPDYRVQGNVLYNRVTRNMFDGLVIWGAQLAHVVGTERITHFCGQFRPLPLVNIGIPLAGIPSVVMDNYQGMHDVVSHLIETHGYRRIAYIRKPKPTSETSARRT